MYYTVPGFGNKFRHVSCDNAKRRGFCDVASRILRHQPRGQMRQRLESKPLRESLSTDAVPYGAHRLGSCFCFHGLRAPHQRERRQQVSLPREVGGLAFSRLLRAGEVLLNSALSRLLSKIPHGSFGSMRLHALAAEEPIPREIQEKARIYVMAVIDEKLKKAARCWCRMQSVPGDAPFARSGRSPPLQNGVVTPTIGTLP